MNKKIRWISALLMLCMLIGCFSGCNKAEEETVATDTVEEVGEFAVTLENLANYTIVIPGEGDESMKSAANSLQWIISKLIGKTPEIVTDEQTSEYEILVGLVDRAETKEFYAKVRHYDSGYALVGKKVLILGHTNNAASDSVMLFKSELLDKVSETGVLMQATDKKIVGDDELNAQYEWLERSKSKFYSETLEGLRVNAIGDSYFNYSKLDQKYVWLSLMAKKYGMQMNNFGKGGSTVSNYQASNPMCERYTGMFANDADIILIEGGANDMNRDTPLGTSDSYDKNTFSGALNVIIEGVKERYPDAMVVCISMWNVYSSYYADKTTKTYLDYANAMEAVAERQGVYFIAAYDPAVSGVDMSNVAFRAKYSYKTADPNHLNAEGMKIAMEHFEKVLASYYEDFLSKKAA